ncbi:MAG TPA: CoA transferase [Methylomirabilota bacterium]|jgi:crotonobetainyl-CoA:carnitine CoA-transferase CaiB-like acyl-CoA transferase|nr:CoA transferase [Methylomirabilota bacterium]
MNNATPSALAELRVLDLTDLKGALCAKLLGDMGADVIKLEPPSGDATRSIGPFLNGKPHRDRSLLFWFYNTSKRGITLDLHTTAGQELLRQLVTKVDVIVESFAPGTLAQLGLGYEELKRMNPQVVLTSITPFGQTGPYRDYASSDTVAEALGGMIYVNGAPNEPPLRALGLQAYHSASFFAAIGTMSALWAREAIGEGQWVDISIQEATAACVEHVAPFYHQGLGVETRRGSLHWSRYFRVARCKDGYIMHCTLGDWTSLVEWVKMDDKAQDLSDPQWEDLQFRKANAARLFDVLDDWAKEYTIAELMEGAQLRRIPYAMVRAPEALVDDPQLNARGFFSAVAHPELGKTFRYPGGPFFFTKTPWRISRRPPLLGEHNNEVYGKELGLDEQTITKLAQERVL